MLGSRAGWFLALLVCAVAIGPQVQAKGLSATQQGKNTVRPQDRHPQMPVATDLVEAGTIQFPLPAPTAVEVGARCDSEGDMYAVWSDAEPTVEKAATGQSVMSEISTSSEPVRELVLDSKRVIEFRMPPIPNYKYQVRWSYNTSPDGHLYILVQARNKNTPEGGNNEATYFIEKFKSDGTFDSRAELEGPSSEYFEPYKFAVFADGRFLILGMTGSVKSGDWRPFAGIFDSDGRFAAKVDFAVDAKAKYAGIVRGGGTPEDGSGQFLAVNFGNMNSDPDGDVYITLAGSPVHVIVVSPSGEVEKEIRLRVPAAGLSSAEAGVIGSGLVYVHFGRVNSTGAAPVNEMIGVVNVSLGQFDRLYRLPAGLEERFMGVCGDTEGNFQLLEASPKNKLEVVKYSAE